MPQNERQIATLSNAASNTTRNPSSPATPTLPTTPPPQPQDELSDYERQRLAKIQENAVFLASLGLAAAKSGITRPAPTKTKTKTKRSAPNSAVVTREYSLRCRGPKPPTPLLPTETLTPSSSQSAAVADAATFDDSTVYKYICSRDESSPQQAASFSAGAASQAFRTETQWDRVDPQLKRIYAIDASSAGLLATGGHLGFVSVYADDVGAAGSAPLQSFQAHKGWVSGARFVPHPTQTLLITTANDTFVKLWDLNQASGATPRQVAATNDLHSKGIFSFDLATDDAPQLLTSSKDRSVVHSRIMPDGAIQRLSAFEDHASVVKCVRFAAGDANIFASCGNDRAVIVRDIRVPAKTSVEFEDVHAQAVNCVRWHPAVATQLVSAGFDGQLHLLDTRQPASPVLTITTTPTTKLFNPEFVQDEFIVLCLNKTLTVYSAKTGEVITQGEMAYQPESILVPAGPPRILVAHSQILSLYVC
ncbi:hypothetical protein ACHHYP_00235 [Achlya hypogyna]|uniref:Uncharacterized protein n=1 Tax=Achlya hypogyna TaxID=1202772 RepID=A0A1V9ZB08_ACHHY|nr:hypothetical protein ACHHYP_00235 [Achlya hypogyna]